MDIEIRLFEKQDKPLVEKFFSDMGSESRFFFNATGYNYQRSMRFFGDDPDPDILHWIAVEDGKMVGYVFIWNIHMKIVELGIAVADDMKGKHFGVRLLDTVKQWCCANDKGGILLTTHPANIRAQSLYRRNGFQHIGVSNNKGEFLFLYNMPQV